MASDLDRRTEPRIYPQDSVFVEYPNQRPRVRDISLSGAYIEDSRPLPRGRVIPLRLWLDQNNAINVQVMVRHSEEGIGMGVEFLGMNDNDRQRLRQFVSAPGQVRTS